MDIKEFKENIPSYIQQAINVGIDTTGGRIQLTTSMESIDDLDKVVDYIHNLYLKKLLDDNVAWNISVYLGTLLGEMIMNEGGFYWTINDDDIPVLENEKNNMLSPITKLYKIITDDNSCEGTAKGFYNAFKALEKYDSMSEEEKEKITTYINKPEE